MIRRAGLDRPRSCPQSEASHQSRPSEGTRSMTEKKQQAFAVFVCDADRNPINKEVLYFDERGRPTMVSAEAYKIARSLRPHTPEEPE